MTEKAAAVAPVWVLDATCLSHFARAERLDVLRDLLVDKECWTAREAVRVARTYGLDVHGTIWLLAGACRDGKPSEPAAGNLIDALRSTGMRLPCTGAEFSDYARRYGLL